MENEEQPKKKKKSLGLSARQSFRRQRRMQGYRNDRQTVLELISAAVIIFLIWFVLSGGINQKAFIDECGRIAHNVGSWFSEKFGGDNIKVTDQGVYIDGQAPDGAKELDNYEKAVEKEKEVTIPGN